MLAIVVTSLLRDRIGVRLWRLIHWLAYLSWPVAVLHGIGTGTDSSAPWMLAITVVSIASVCAALAFRLAARGDPLGRERLVGRERLGRAAQ
jgi:DMSO/TMAO reductase YedYZ heme-binding membrane subunit